MNIKEIEPMNDSLKFFYQNLQTSLPKSIFIDYPQDLLLADPNHKWGLAAVHYRREFYQESLVLLRGIR